MAKVLRDRDFWKALDSISGSNWPIFAVRPLTKAEDPFGGRGYGNRNSMSMIISTSDEPRSNMQILKDFGLENSRSLPVFVAFIWDDQDNLNEITVPIEGFNTDTVYSSIESIVKVISDAENKVLPEYKRTENVFRNVVEQLEAHQFRNTVIRRGKIALRYAEFLSMFA